MVSYNIEMWNWYRCEWFVLKETERTDYWEAHTLAEQLMNDNGRKLQYLPLLLRIVDRVRFPHGLFTDAEFRS